MQAAVVVALIRALELAALAVLAAVARAVVQTVRIRRAQLILAAAAARADVVPVSLTARLVALASLLSATPGRKFIPAAS